jgi:hypothetical protein
MAYLTSDIHIERTVVVTYLGKKYTTVRGFASMLADRMAGSMMMRFHMKGTNVKKYGLPYLAKTHRVALKRFNANESRLRTKAYRRILPIIERLFHEARTS